MNVIKKNLSTDFGFMQSHTGALGWTSIARVSVVVSQFITQLVLIRIMGAEEYGQFAYIYGFMAVYIILMSAGLPAVSVREVASGINDRSYMHSFKSWVNKRFLIFVIITIVLALGLAIFGYTYLSNFNVKVYLVGILVSGFAAYCLIYQGMLQGASFVVKSQLPEGVFKPFVILLIVGILIVSSIEISALVLMWVYCIAGLLSCLWAVIEVSSLLKKNKNINASKEKNTRELKKTANDFLYISLIGFLLTRFDVIIVGSFLGPKELTAYLIVVRIVELIGFSIFVSNIVISPKIAQLNSAKKKNELYRYLGKASRITFYLTLMSYLIMLIAGKYVLNLYGKDFEVFYYLIYLMGASQVAQSFFGPLSYYLGLTGETKISLKLQSLSALISIVLLFILVPYLGLIGAAAAYTFSTLINSIIMYTYVLKSEGKGPLIFW